jgi:hypothetical protein
MPDLSKLLVDTMTFRCRVLEESNNGPRGTKYVARGEFARSDRATENKRLYPHSLWERELGRLSPQLKEMKVYGELDHPMDGRTQLKRASHIITDLHLEGNIVMGTAYIMDTDQGRNLRAILDAGGAVGVSSRGFGTTRPNLKGEDVVQPDYRLMTFDFVAEPAMSSAYPKVSTEDTEPRATEAVMEENMTLEELREQHPELYGSFMADAERDYEKRAAEIWAKKISGAKDEASTDLRAEFAEKLEAAIAEMRKEVEETVRAKMLADPTVAAAKKTLDEVKSLLRPYVVSEDVESVVSEKEGEVEAMREAVAEAELRMANLQLENDKLAAIAKEAGYRYHLEQQLHGTGHADLIRNLIGDVMQYSTIAEMDERVSDIVEEVEKQEAEQSQHDAEVDQLREELATQKLIAEKALEATKHLAARVYAEERLAHHPNANMARSLIESKSPATKEEVDSLLSSVHRPTPMVEDLDAVRARVRALTGSNTREYLQEQEETPSRNGSNGAGENYNGLGTSLTEIRDLAGLDDPNRN